MAVRRRALHGGGSPQVSEQVGDLVMVVSNSRSGSSFLMELLARATGLVHLQGEINPLLRLAGLDPWSSGSDSDALDERHLTEPVRRALDVELAVEVGGRSEELDGTREQARFARRVWRRLRMQWPAEGIPLDVVRHEVSQTLIELRAEHGWSPAQFRDPELFLALLLGRLHRRFPRLHPGYYDVAPALLERAAPGLGRPEGPPADAILEEPPFIRVTPWRTSSAHELRSRPLVVKAPSNAYRFGFFRALFPRATVRVLHLTRNPAASINGLMDGWLHGGFHAHRMARPLGIAGYADVRPADARWWKFDLPPGWRSWTERPLADVCAFQWSSAHRSVLRFVAEQRPPYCRVRFEDLISSPGRRDRTVRELCAWLGIPDEGERLAGLAGALDPVMTTRPPRPRRWAERADQLGSVLASQVVRQTARDLGYDDEATWI